MNRSVLYRASTGAALLVLLLFCLLLLYRNMQAPVREDQKWFDRHIAFNSRVAAQLQPSANSGPVFLGDSHIQGLCASCIIPASVNFGIGKATISITSKQYLAVREHLGPTHMVVQAGHNDIALARDEAIIAAAVQLISRIADDGHQVHWHSQLPVATGRRFDPEEAAHINRRKQAINTAVAEHCNQTRRCNYIDVATPLSDEGGYLRRDMQLGDGIHLNTRGNLQWHRLLQQEVMQETGQ